MEPVVLYEENYIFEHGKSDSNFYFHIDYGTRYFDINMPFPHFHSFFEVYVLLKGSANHIIEGEAFELHPFDIVTLNNNTLHKTSYHEGEPCQRVIFNFSYEAFKKFFPDAISSFNSLFVIEQPIYRFDNEITEKLISFLNNIYKISKTNAKTKNLSISTNFFDFLNTIFLYKDNNRYTNNPLPSTADEKMHLIASYIHDHYSEDIGLTILSELFYLNSQYLSRQFKKTIGFTLIQYIQETRIKKAQVLLLDTKFKVTYIANHCGFGSLSQFNRVFSKVCNMSPTTFRKNNTLN